MNTLKKQKLVNRRNHVNAVQFDGTFDCLKAICSLLRADNFRVCETSQNPCFGEFFIGGRCFRLPRYAFVLWEGETDISDIRVLSSFDLEGEFEPMDDPRLGMVDQLMDETRALIERVDRLESEGLNRRSKVVQ